MTRSDLIAALAADHPHLRQAHVERIVEVVFEHVTDALARGQKVELRDFGIFGIKQRKARTGRNPRTGDAVSVDAKATLYFRTGRGLHSRLNRRSCCGSA
jgi:integration host factor subunit beta